MQTGRRRLQGHAAVVVGGPRTQRFLDSQYSCMSADAPPFFIHSRWCSRSTKMRPDVTVAPQPHAHPRAGPSDCGLFVAIIRFAPLVALRTRSRQMEFGSVSARCSTAWRGHASRSANPVPSAHGVRAVTRCPSMGTSTPPASVRNCRRATWESSRILR